MVATLAAWSSAVMAIFSRVASQGWPEKVVGRYFMYQAEMLENTTAIRFRSSGQGNAGAGLELVHPFGKRGSDLDGRNIQYYLGNHKMRKWRFNGEGRVPR